MSLIVTGSIGIDTVETPRERAVSVLGGSSSYFAAAASFFGPVRIVGAVGEDFPDVFYKTLEHFNLDLRGVEKRVGSQTFRWRGKYHQNMNHRETLDVQLNVLDEAIPPVPEEFGDSRYVFLANTHPASQLAMLNQFPHRVVAVADTMDLWIQTERATLTELLGRIDGLVLNNDEAEQLSGEVNLMRAAEKIVEMGPRFVVVKKGEHGALIEQGGAKIVLPAYPARDVTDPTGAGDSFAGGMMGYLAATDDLALPSLRQAMAYGTILASFAIESVSLDRLKQLSRTEIESRHTSFREMLKI